MALLGIHRTPTLTRERYEEVVRRLIGKDHFDSGDELPFDGLVVHATAETGEGFVVIDVFDSQEAIDRFNERMGSMPREIGIEEPPKFFEVHTFVTRPPEPS